MSKDLKEWRWQQVKYEDGADFSEDDWAYEGYVDVNEACAGCNLEVLENGDIIFPVAANVMKCCRILGIDVNDVFPSCPHIMHGLVVFIGRWDEAEKKYDLTPSKTVVISDLKSSRGVDEPIIITLEGGRILVIFRGSNVMSKNWKTRIQRGDSLS